MKKALTEILTIFYLFWVFAAACVILMLVEIINLPGLLFRRKEKS